MTDTPRGGAPGGSRGGFTLIEMMIVAAILALALMIVVPSLDGVTPSYRLRGAVREIGSAIEFARSEAIASGRTTGIVYYRDEQRYAILIPLPETEEGEAQPPAGDQLFSDGRVIIRPTDLPEDVVFDEILGSDNEAFDDPEVVINFDPLGTQGSHIARLRLQTEPGAGREEAFSVRFQSIIGVADFGTELQFEEYQP